MGKQTNQAAVTWHPCGPTFQRLNGFIEVATSHIKRASNDVVEQNTNLASRHQMGRNGNVFVSLIQLFHAVTASLQLIFPTRQLMTTTNLLNSHLIRLFICNYPRFIKQKNIKHINIFKSFQFTNKALRFQPTSSKLVDKLVPPGWEVGNTHFNRTIVPPKILSLFNVIYNKRFRDVNSPLLLNHFEVLLEMAVCDKIQICKHD